LFRLLLLHSSLYFVVVVEIAVLTFALSVILSLFVRTFSSFLIPTLLMVSVVTHIFSVVLSISVRALEDVHSLAVARFDRLLLVTKLTDDFKLFF
jgi:hypothetical protein